MRTTLLTDGPPRQHAVVFDTGDEVVSGLTGWAEQQDLPGVVCGRRDGSTVGGHLLRAVTRPTLEVVVTTGASHLQRRHDPASGLALIDPDAS
ncbi:hypothetical protein [Modestobacter sp. KNN46-3]|jgi:predicted DNA-binding protein with PD1-like motif|uniref:hypothetical protein n=1 Tax=Modestobacter sp. KNN46-3 TaxID=2711218 RepID=UPI0013DEA324|nr:hypothetical protein [Modestobacter sp. KNN46-3]